MSIKRNITDITNLKRGSTNINFVYRGNTLIWQRSRPIVLDTFYNTNGFGGYTINSTDGSTFSFETANLNINYIRI